MGDQSFRGWTSRRSGLGSSQSSQSASQSVGSSRIELGDTDMKKLCEVDWDWDWTGLEWDLLGGWMDGWRKSSLVVGHAILTTPQFHAHGHGHLNSIDNEENLETEKKAASGFPIPLPFGHLEPLLPHCHFHLIIHLFLPLDGTQLDHFPLFVKILDDRHAGLHESLEAFADALFVVVGPAGGFAPVEETLQHDVLGTVEEKRKDAGTDGFFEFHGLVHFAGKAVNEEPRFPLVDFRHGILQQLDGDFHRYDLPLANVGFD